MKEISDKNLLDINKNINKAGTNLRNENLAAINTNKSFAKSIFSFNIFSLAKSSLDASNERGCQFSNERGANERGAGMVEYALLVTLMSIGCMGAVRLMKISVEESFIDVRLALACTGFYDAETNICTP